LEHIVFENLAHMICLIGYLDCMLVLCGVFLNDNMLFFLIKTPLIAIVPSTIIGKVSIPPTLNDFKFDCTPPSGDNPATVALEFESNPVPLIDTILLAWDGMYPKPVALVEMFMVLPTLGNNKIFAVPFWFVTESLF
jgi:hypothetical protein